MANGQSSVGFNRVASGILGAANLNYLQCSVPQPVSKELNSIHIGVAEGSSPVNFVEYLIRVMVCDQEPKIQTILDFSPNTIPSATTPDNLYGDVGNIYYDCNIILPYNNPIIFDEPILFAGSTKIFVICSIPYADGGSIVTPSTYYVKMSINGRLLESPSIRYTQR